MSQPDVHGFVQIAVRIDGRLVEDTAIPLTEPVIERVAKTFHVGRRKVNVSVSFDPYVRAAAPPVEDAS